MLSYLTTTIHQKHRSSLTPHLDPSPQTHNINLHVPLQPDQKLHNDISPLDLLRRYKNLFKPINNDNLIHDLLFLQFIPDGLG